MKNIKIKWMYNRKEFFTLRRYNISLQNTGFYLYGN